MNTAPPNYPDSQEIDLSQISKKIGEMFQSFLRFIFLCIQFLVRNAIYLIVIVFIGVLIGYFLDKQNKIYEHEISVHPNFGSTNLLYSKIDLLDSKISERDTAFLKTLGINNPQSVTAIKVEPIIDIYGFVNERTNTVSNAQNTQNFELLKLLAEGSDISKIIEDDITGRNYSTHLITISTNGALTNQEVVNSIMDFLNSEEFFKNVQQEYVKNIKDKVIKNAEVIEQIDVILNEFAKNPENKKGSNLVYYNENTELNEIIKTKNELVTDQGIYKLELLKLSKIIKDKSTVLNVRKSQSIFLKMKFILPVLFILLFLFFKGSRSFYKTQLEKYKSTT